MPMYVYKCRVCGKEIVIRASGIDSAPDCCGVKSKLLIQPVNFSVEDGTGAYKG